MAPVTWGTKDELIPLKVSPPAAYENSDVNEDDDDEEEKERRDTFGLIPPTGAQGFTKHERISYHFKALRTSIVESIYDFTQFGFNQESVRSRKRARLNVVMGSLLILSILALVGVAFFLFYERVYLPIHKRKQLQAAIRAHAAAALIRAQKCQGIDWRSACDQLGAAGARRRLYTGKADRSNEIEEKTLWEDDPQVTYDENCLRIYRLNMLGNITFPYHASQLLLSGGNQTMALFIQHGAMRNAEDYFCSFKKLMEHQTYRNFEDILMIAPDFNYESDNLVHPLDAFWNSSKPWGDWRVGAESDPSCCGNQGKTGVPRTISSFEVLDNMLAMLTDKELFPRMNKISYVGHSAGGQMVQRYAVMSVLASLYDLDDEVDMEFIIANPSSYTYLTPERYSYSCGNCKCNTGNCTCSEECTKPPYSRLGIPHRADAGTKFPCYQWNYDRWPYGIGSFTDQAGHYVPYALRDGRLGVTRALRLYQKLHVVYLLGQNDTCNDGLPVCDSSCWKRNHYEKGEWPCFRNQMDTRCPAMLQGPCRRTRGHQYMAYLENLYGRPTHNLHTVPGVGHNATAMFFSEIGMRELFD